MSLESLTAKINKNVEEMELATARVYIEENIGILNEHRNMLNKNAREYWISSCKCRLMMDSR
ncbi:hypothetical protein LC048_02655 [Mesobacillus subterraneus]|uniref:hypothetical protein n=1 Tax=Mesobacillus subterraneus TaxID=285983 RepID=UPI001CFED15A|nr:hypothetical protein [Mesobacillus subterraneus]WLR55920.1 hypothetical protein LC048_02655 [Mesobacillus subterraneus]